MAKMFCSLEEAAAKLKVSPDEVRAMVDQRQLEAFGDRDGDRLMLKVEHVDLLAQTVKKTSSFWLDEGETNGTPTGNTGDELPRASIFPPRDLSEPQTGISIFDADATDGSPEALAAARAQGAKLFDTQPAAQEGSGIIDLTSDSNPTEAPPVETKEQVLSSHRAKMSELLGSLADGVFVEAFRSHFCRDAQTTRTLIDTITKRLTPQEAYTVLDKLTSKKVAGDIADHIKLAALEAQERFEAGDQGILRPKNCVPLAILIGCQRSLVRHQELNPISLALVTLQTAPHWDTATKLAYLDTLNRSGLLSGGCAKLLTGYLQRHTDKVGSLSKIGAGIVRIHQALGLESNQITDIATEMMTTLFLDPYDYESRYEFFSGAVQGADPSSEHRQVFIRELFQYEHLQQKGIDLNRAQMASVGMDLAQEKLNSFKPPAPARRWFARWRSPKVDKVEASSCDNDATNFYPFFESLRTAFESIDAARQEMINDVEAAPAQSSLEPVAAGA